nr:unnamed protein product [Digitaria exilis]
MGDASASAVRKKGEAKVPAAASAMAVARDDSYLESVTDKRIRMFEEIQTRQALQRLNIGGEAIKVTILPDGAIKEGKTWITTPMDIAKEISSGLAASCLIAQVDETLWDMGRPLEGDCELQFFKFDSNEGRDTFWHSSAHILGESLERAYGCKLCLGPCTTRGEGFYYDAYYNGLTLNEEHFGIVENQARKAVAVEIIKELPEDKTITVYRCGHLVDLCRGPHIPNTSFVKAFACLKASSSYWRGKADRESLQRVYGISFPDSRRLKVISPNIYNMQLWETSGHAANYKENMFIFEIEKQEFGLKPMSCPGHCLMFNNRVRSYRELPLRLADFGVLHRNELSGALTGLTRVRRFQQDDAHIFCRENQIKDEVNSVLEFINYVYEIFGFKYELELSTRPEKYLGDIETWNKAEQQLTEALNEFGKPWQINEGDGAFYGPKIDIGVFDALKRKFQCATLQLDFQLPLRFKLYYSAEDEAKTERPVMIHRAILGSVERMFAILLEHYNGKWPLWLSPRQAIVCSVSSGSVEYAKQVLARLHEAGFDVDIDISDRTIQKKVQGAQAAQFNYILVVGAREAETGNVCVRARDSAALATMSVDGIITCFREEIAAFK